MLLLLPAFGSSKSFRTGVELRGVIKIKKERESANNILITNTDVIKCLSKNVVM